MSGTRHDQDAWVERVLGITRGGARGATPGANIDRRATWRSAKELVDERLTALADELRSYDNPDLQRIADLGLFGIGKNENVALAKALIEYEAAGAAAGAKPAEAVRNAVANYRATLAGNAVVRQIDRNPFGVNVAMAATLGAALDQIERSLA